MPRRRRASKRIVKPFDATTKYLLELDPAAWLDYVGLPSAGPMAVVDSDVATEIAHNRAMVRECIAELPEQYRVVLMLRDIEVRRVGPYLPFTALRRTR